MVSFILMNERKLEFIARTITDIGKAIIIASIIGNLFKEMPVWAACTTISLGILLVLVGTIILPGDKK